MILAAIALQISAAAFAPPEGVPLRIVTERVQDGNRQYTMERIIRFTREGSGYRAEVRMIAATGLTADRSGELYEAGFGAFAGQTIVFHLDAGGAVLAIDDLDALWTSFRTRVAEAAASRRSLAPAARDQLAQRIAAALGALPAERRRDLVGSLVSAVIAEDSGTQPGVQPIRVPGTSPTGQQVMLEGTRTSTRVPGSIEIRTSAGADIALQAEAGAPAGSGKLSLETLQRHDPLTGLIASSSETTRTISGTAETIRTTTVRVERAAE